MQRAQADLTLLEQKQKDRYSKPEVAKVQAQGAEARLLMTPPKMPCQIQRACTF